MSVDHLADKRTGRPRGSKSTPPWVRDARWAYRHFADESAVPPSPFAARLVAQARVNPGTLLHALVVLDGPLAKGDTRPPDVACVDQAAARKRPVAPPATIAPGGGVRKFSVPLGQLVGWMFGHGEPAWMARHLPDTFEVVVVVIQRARRRAVLAIRSSAFTPTAEGEPVQTVECD